MWTAKNAALDAVERISGGPGRDLAGSARYVRGLLEHFVGGLDNLSIGRIGALGCNQLSQFLRDVSGPGFARVPDHRACWPVAPVPQEKPC